MEQEKQENVIADYVEDQKQIEIEIYERAIKKARNALFWAGGLYFFWEMIGMYNSDVGFNITWFIIAIIEAGIFVALAFWTKKKPFTAVVTGLIIFIGLIILSAVAFGMEQGSTGVAKSLFSGIIVKILIIANLIMPLKDAKELQAAKKEQARYK